MGRGTGISGCSTAAGAAVCGVAQVLCVRPGLWLGVGMGWERKRAVAVVYMGRVCLRLRVTARPRGGCAAGLRWYPAPPAAGAFNLPDPALRCIDADAEARYSRLDCTLRQRARGRVGVAVFRAVVLCCALAAAATQCNTLAPPAGSGLIPACSCVILDSIDVSCGETEHKRFRIRFTGDASGQFLRRTEHKVQPD
jgi:hypothetical protein